MIEDKTLYQAIELAAKKRPHNLAMYYKGKRISYRKMLKRIDRMADILIHQIGVKKDDVVFSAKLSSVDLDMRISELLDKKTGQIKKGKKAEDSLYNIKEVQEILKTVKYSKVKEKSKAKSAAKKKSKTV